MDCPSCGHEARKSAKFCEECGARLASAPAQPEGERRQLTVMFVDLVGSTALSERLDPEDFGEVIAAYQATCRRVVESWGGFAARTFGDGLLVYFGYPKALEDAAYRAIRAGREIAREVPRLTERYKDRLPYLSEQPLAVRVGIHTGLVVIGEITTGGTEEHVALGGAMNVAARLQGVAGPNQVVVSDATLRLVPGLFLTRDLGTPPLKGVSEPIRAHAVLQPTGARSRLAVDPSRLTPLVGRDRELQKLRELWRKAEAGTGQTVLLRGEPGVGKSRLPYALRQNLAGRPHSWLECHSTSYSQGSAFFPLIELIEQNLGFTTEHDAEEKLSRLERGVEASGLPTEEVVPLLAPLLLLPVPDRYPQLQESPALLRKMTIEALVRWVLVLAERQPMVLLVEDLHWCDASTLEFLGLLMEQGATAPLLTLLTFRPEFEPSWSDRLYVTQLDIGHLDREDAVHLVEGVRRKASLPEAVVQRIVDTADGVPLFLEELTKTVAEAGTESVGTDLPVPATIQSSLMSRLDRLDQGKSVAQMGAVLGREFSRGLLEALSGKEAVALDAGISELVTADLLYERGEAGTPVYSFSHALIRDAAYDSLLRSRRQALHRAAATALRETERGQDAVPLEAIAHHLTHAEQLDEAIVFWKRAGERAASRHASVEAIQHLENGLALLGRLPQTEERDRDQLDFLFAIGGQFASARGYGAPEVLKTYERARMLCEQLRDERRLLRVLGGLFGLHANRGEFDRARSLAQQLLALAEAKGEPLMTQRGHASLGLVHFMLGEHAKARHHMGRGLELYRKTWHRPHALQDPGVAVGTQVAVNLWYCGFPDQALEAAQRATKLASELKHPYSIALGLVHEAIVHNYRGETGAVLCKAEKGLEIAEKHAIPYLSGMAIAWKGYAIGKGDPAAGAELISTGSERMKAAGGVAWRLYHKGLIAELQSRQGRYDQALRSLRPPAKGDRGAFVPELLRLCGEILWLYGRDPDARPYFDRAIELSRTQDAKSLELRAATSLARLWHSQGKTAEARDLLAPVYDWFTEGFDTQDLKDAKALLGELG